MLRCGQNQDCPSATEKTVGLDFVPRFTCWSLRQQKANRSRSTVALLKNLLVNRIFNL
jgi:hypothetical protein